MSCSPSAALGARDCTLRTWAARVFTLDVRSLAAMRIGLGLVLLVNLGDLVGDVSSFYTDAGILPRADLRELNIEEQFTAPPPWISLHMLSGEAWLQYLLLAVSALFALAVLVGYRTQAALLGSCLLLAGLQARNPMPLNAGDDVLRCLLWWSIFLPLGAAWSFDRRHSCAAPTHVCSVASAALLLQLGCIYFCSGVLKRHPIWRSEFTALYYALALDHLTTWFGYELLGYPRFLKALTAGTLVIEVAGPLLMLCPWRNSQLRGGLVAVFCGLHLGIAATLNIGLFPLTCIVYWLALLPSEFWNWLTSARDRAGRWWRGRAAAEPRAVAVLRPMMFAPTSFMIQSLAAALLLCVLLLNYVRLGNNVAAHLQPGPLRVLIDAAPLNQFWCMFAPRPHDFGGWYNLHGTLRDGTEVNLLHPELPPQATRPLQVNATYPNARWCKLLMNLYERNCPTFRRGVGEYLCRRWNATHGAEQQLVGAEILLLAAPILLPGESSGMAPAVSPRVLWQWQASQDLSTTIDRSALAD